MDKDLLWLSLERHTHLQRPYLALYRKLLAGKYKGYLNRANEAIKQWNDPHCAINPADMVQETLLYGTSFDEYLLYHFYEKSRAQRSAYLTDTIRNRICHRANSSKYQRMLLDKYQSYCYFRNAYQRQCICLSGDRPEEAAPFLQRYGEGILKPVCNCAGRGVRLVTPTAPLDLRPGENYILEQRILQDSRMARFHPQSVNTLRANTILRHGQFQLLNAFVRTGRGDAVVDNGGQGGLFASVDPRTGVIVTDGFDEHGHRYSTHPETGIPYRGTTIPEWEPLLALAERLARQIPQLAYVSWDFALTPQGWVMVEGNKGQFIAQQVTQEKGLRKDFEEALA